LDRLYERWAELEKKKASAWESQCCKSVLTCVAAAFRRASWIKSDARPKAGATKPF